MGRKTQPQEFCQTPFFLRARSARVWIVPCLAGSSQAATLLILLTVVCMTVVAAMTTASCICCLCNSPEGL